MANEKQINSRIQMKHDIEANWYAAGTATKPFIPKAGEIIIYDPDAIYGVRTKIGDGETPVHLLPWASGCDETVGLEFELSQDKSYFICSGIGSFRGGELIIPRGHCGLPVKEIGDNAFSEIGFDEDPQLQFSGITKVIIPYGIEIIGKWAFYLDYYFVNGGITIPNSVHTLKEGAFWAAQYDYIYIPKSVITNDSWLFGDGMGIELKKVYCEYFENELPNTWHSSWNVENVPVVWGATKDIFKLNEKQLASAENISLANKTSVDYDADGIWMGGHLLASKDEGETEMMYIPLTTLTPIVAGDNVTFEVDNKNQVVKINATGGAPQTSITYSELKTLRDNSQLTPGMFYHITDYQCTTTQENTRAMNNQFDIVIQALDVNKLSENASATWHEGDTYFADANLAAWELKYSFDNNANRFWWADEEKGKGIIYYMKDENNNECPYDFKNIQFKRYKVVRCEEVPNYVGQYIATQDDLDIDAPDEIEWDADDFIWCYTFTIVLEGVITDYSMFREELLVENNNVKAYSQYGRQMLNNNVFISPHGFETEDDSHFFGNNIIDGVYNTISVDYYIRENSIIGICNTFSSYGVEEANIEGSNNLFGGDVYNVILPNCHLNIFSGFAQDLSFGPGCTYNYFGNIKESSLGCRCSNIRFCYPDYTPQYYLRRLVVGNGCSQVKLINNEEGKQSNYVQDITISSGIQKKELQVSRNAAPVVFEAANTTHIILD